MSELDRHHHHVSICFIIHDVADAALADAKLLCERAVRLLAECVLGP